MKLLAILILCFTFSTAYCQDGETLVKEGVKLHDSGKYEEAINKFDAAIALNKNNYRAYYEKSYSLLAANKLKESSEVSKYILKNFKDDLEPAGLHKLRYSS